MPLRIYTVLVWMRYRPARGIAHNANLDLPSALHGLLEQPSDGVAVLVLNGGVRKPRTI